MDKFFSKHSSYMYSDEDAISEIIKKLKEAKHKLQVNPSDQSVCYDLAKVHEMLHDYFEELKIDPKELQSQMQQYPQNPFVNKQTKHYDGRPKSHLPNIYPYVYPMYPYTNYTGDPQPGQPGHPGYNPNDPNRPR